MNNPDLKKDAWEDLKKLKANLVDKMKIILTLLLTFYSSVICSFV